MKTVYILGIDMSKKKFDAALTLDGMTFYEEQVDNNLEAINLFFQELKKKFQFSFSQLILCVEHTGIYCNPLLEFTLTKKINICVEPAMQIKQSQGMTRGKNDKIDARRIALYAYKNLEMLRFWKPQREIIQKIKALLTVRERLVKTRVQLKTPLNETDEFIGKSIRKIITNSCQKTLASLKADITKIEKSIDEIISQDQGLSENVRFATSVPGIGRITALNVIITTGEFERIKEGKKFACYTGVAPFEHRSGSSIRGKTRVSKMANMTLKKLLHLSAMSAIQCSDELKKYYNRKTEQGKNKMSVLNAVRNKLISRVFACVKDQRVYEKFYQNDLA
jgi:transposase